MLKTMDGHSDFTEARKEALLKQKVALDNGEEGYVFSFSTEEHAKGRWKCHVCRSSIFSSSSLEAHVSGKNHTKKMAHNFHPHEHFSRVSGKDLNQPGSDLGIAIAKSGEVVPTLAPGEPVPPGLEDVVKWVPEIQGTLDGMKATMIGLEWLVELTPSYNDEEPKYYCMMCDKKGDSRTVLTHLISFSHRIKYLERYFPKAFNALNNLPKTKELRRGTMEILARIVTAIETKLGRLRPYISEAAGFDEKKNDVAKQIVSGPHFHETADSSYESLVDIEKAEEYSKEGVELLIDKDKKEAMLKGSAKYRPGQPTPEEREKIKIVLADKKHQEKTEPKKSSPDRKKVSPDRKFIKKNSPERKTAPIRKRSPIREHRSVSIISSASSKSRSRSRSRSRKIARSRSRSHSRSYSSYRGPSYKREDRYRRMSPLRSRYRRSRTRSRSRSRSLSPLYARRRLSPGYRGRSPGYTKTKTSYRPVRYDSIYDDEDNYGPSDRPKTTHDKVAELRNQRNQKTKYQDLISNLERDMLKKLRFYEKNPEKHPLYPEEWKKFWNRRYKELVAQGADASKHDFKPEWIKFWTVRMKELHEEDLARKKADYKVELGIDDSVVEISPTPLEDEVKPVTVDDIKVTWKALTGSVINHESPLKKQKLLEDEEKEKDQPVRVITVLRLLAALEGQLGSLGPKVNTLLSQAISMDKRTAGASESIMCNNEHCVLFETLKEKLKGQLFAGIVEKNMVNATRLAIQNTAELLTNKDNILKERLAPKLEKTPFEPLMVPGIGVVDKVAIAQQIAATLVQQGKTDVTEEELEQLIDAVVGMAQASTAAIGKTETPAAAVTNTVQMTAPKSVNTIIPGLNSDVPQKSGLSLLQAYNDPPNQMNKTANYRKMSELTEDDMKMLLQNFKDLSPNEQQYLISFLKQLEVEDPTRVEKLRKFVHFGSDKKVSNEGGRTESGRLSPFSLREGGANPLSDGAAESRSNNSLKDMKSYEDKNKRDSEDDDDDDDYFAKLSKTVNSKSVAQEVFEQQKKKTKIVAPSADEEVITIEPDDHSSAAVVQMQQAKDVIALMMGNLVTSSKYSTPSRLNPAPEVNFVKTSAPAISTPTATGAPASTDGNNLLDDYNYQDDIFGYSRGQEAPPPNLATAPPSSNDYSYTAPPLQQQPPPQQQQYQQSYDNYNSNSQPYQSAYNQQPPSQQQWNDPSGYNNQYQSNSVDQGPYNQHTNYNYNNQGYNQPNNYNSQYPGYY